MKRYLWLLNLAPSIQEKLSTSEGPVGVGTLSKLAETFAPEQQEKVLEEIGGFKQTAQLEIIRKSGGDLGKVPVLTEQALEGAFDMRTCREGLCFEMPEALKFQIKQALKQGQDMTSFKAV